ncbi:MAG: calcium-translocating P-type ATPase, SERCA-type [Chloroflexia bacterium]
MENKRPVLEEAYRLPAEEVARRLQTDLKHGLSTEQARSLLQEFGPNELPEEAPTPLWRRFLNQFRSFLVIILLVAALISLVVAVFHPEGGGEEYVDAAAIFAIVLLNAVLGVVQESRAENALRALRQMAAPSARVLRDGHVQTIPARELVPGDLVLLEAGNYVPADLRLVESVNLRIEEAALTGESVPVEKHAAEVLQSEIPVGDRLNSAFMGTVVSYGRGKGIVTATGRHTQLGLIAEMLRAYEAEPTPLQVKLDQLGRWLGIAALVVCGIIFVLGLVQNWPPPAETLLVLFMTAVSLAIAAVPEGLPAVVTICLALGTQRMLRRHALIRNLPAVETLGSATVICSDKTGTLTQNEMTVVKVWAGGLSYGVEGRGYQPWGRLLLHGEEVRPEERPALCGVLLGGLLCNDARLERLEVSGEERYRMVGDPTEGALVVLAAKAGLWQEEVEKRLPRIGEIPFDSVRKRMTTLHAWASGRGEERLPFLAASPYLAFTKGAPDLLLERSRYLLDDGRIRLLGDRDRAEILAVMDGMAGNALRVLAVACRPLQEWPENPRAEEVEQDLIFLGLVGMIDPPRPEVRDAIRTAREAGIKTIMITGDHKRTAMAIASDLYMFTPGLQGLTGEELDRMDEETFRPLAAVVDVYSRVSPQHKVRIVDALKAQGHIVAMTGDGVNDAPAVKRADIGVAMGITGTDVAKEAADMVLTDDNYASIVAAIEEGRVIFSNIRKFVYYLLSCNVGEILIVFLATLLNLPALPFLPIHLLMLNLVTDGLPALALGMEPPEPDVMKRPPRPPKEPIIHREMWWGIAVQSVLIAAATLAAFLIGLRWYEGQAEQITNAQTLALTTLVTAELLRAFTARSERVSLWRLGLLSNRSMLWAVASSFLILLAIIYVPFLDPVFHTTFLTLPEWGVLLPLALLPALGAEATKAWLRWRAARRVQAVPSVVTPPETAGPDDPPSGPPEGE